MIRFIERPVRPWKHAVGREQLPALRAGPAPPRAAAHAGSAAAPRVRHPRAASAPAEPAAPAAPPPLRGAKLDLTPS